MDETIEFLSLVLLHYIDTTAIIQHRKYEILLYYTSNSYLSITAQASHTVH